VKLCIFSQSLLTGFFIFLLIVFSVQSSAASIWAQAGTGDSSFDTVLSKDIAGGNFTIIGGLKGVEFGVSEDKPIPNAYIR